ncbi:MAG: hypothetical protein R8M45_00100 [Ghiorsea sp.]
MTSKLKIHNWDKWQSYRKDRGQPPWIKIHREIMRNPNWVSLTDAQRGQIVSIWLLAADSDGAIPSDAEFVRKICFMDSPLSFKVFIEQGFIDSDANVTPERQPDDAPDKIREEKRREERAMRRAQAFSDFYSIYPKKKDRKRASLAWNKIKQSSYPKIMNALANACKSPDWQKDNGQFIPNATTWLNGERWEDEDTTVVNIQNYPPRKTIMQEIEENDALLEAERMEREG